MGKGVRFVFQLLLDIAFFGLMLVGVGGVIYKVIKPEGWLRTAWDALWSGDPLYALLFLGGAAAVFVPVRNWLDSLNTKTTLGNFIAYAWILLGLYFSARWALTGDL